MKKLIESRTSEQIKKIIDTVIVKFTQIVFWLMVFGLMKFSMGCSVQKTLVFQAPENSFVENHKIVSIILHDGQEIAFDDAGARYNSKTGTINGYRSMQNSSQASLYRRVYHLSGSDVKKELVTVKIQNIKSAKISEVDVVATFVLCGVIAATTYGLVAVIHYMQHPFTFTMGRID